MSSSAVFNHLLSDDLSSMVVLLAVDLRSYSYYIEVSMDDKDYDRIIDNTSYLCRSWQKLHFPARVVRCDHLTYSVLFLCVCVCVCVYSVLFCVCVCVCACV